MLVLLSGLGLLFVVVMTAITSDIFWLRVVAWTSLGLFAIVMWALRTVMKK